MKEVWLVYIVYQYDGYYDTAVYSTKEKAYNAADKLVREYKDTGYSIANGYDDVIFSRDIHGEFGFIRLADKYGGVEISVEKKILDKDVLI